MSGPLHGVPGEPVVGHHLCHFIPRSVVGYCRPTTIMGPILDTVVVSCDVVGTSCEELGWHVNMYLLCPFNVPIRVHCFASLIVTLRAYKAGGHPCANLRPLARTPIASSPHSLRLEQKRGREIDLETGEKVVEFTEHCFSFPSKLWWSWAGPRQQSRRHTYRTP
jgi:hypothetical protein